MVLVLKNYIVQGFNLAQKEETYITQFSSNPNLQNQAKSLLQEITSKYNWMLKYQSWFWNTSDLYSEFQVSIPQMQNLYESAVRANLRTENVSFAPTAYLQAWINENYSAWNYGARLNFDDTSSIITKFNAAILAQPWNFYKITINNKVIPNSVYFCFIKSIKLVWTNSHQYNIEVWTKPNVSLDEQQDEQRIVIYNGQSCGSIFIDNDLIAKTIELSKPEKQNILKNEIKVIQTNLALNKNNFNFNLEKKLVLDEKMYINNTTSNPKILNILFNLWSNLNYYSSHYSNSDSISDLTQIQIYSIYYLLQFKVYLKKINNLYLAVTQPAKMGLSIMKNTESVVNKYAQEMKGIAIASTVATAIGIGLAALPIE